MNNRASYFPPLQDAYQDQFGPIETDMYETALEIWPQAERFATDILGDSHLGVELMLKSVARVCAMRKSGVEIIKPKFYLLRTFKNLVLADYDKAKSRNGILLNHFGHEDLQVDQESAICRKILLDELRLQMDDWTRAVFDHLVLGFSFEELVPRFGSASNVIRSKYHKKLRRLTALSSRRLNY